jgi:small-conductance mechanosensitive channel
MNFVLTPWPDLDRAIWTVATILAAYAVGLILNWLIVHRLQRLAAKTAWDWDDPIITEIRKRIPFWALLVGVTISVEYWPQLSDWWKAAIPNTTRALIVLSVTSAFAAITVRLLTVVVPRLNPQAQITGIMRGIVRGVIFVVGILVVLKGLGVEITPMLAALGVGGLAVALALQEVLSNLFAGLFVTFGGQMRIGDYVKVEGGPEGYITDFKWRATQIQTLPGNLVIVPNSKLSQAVVTNFTRPTPDMGITVEVTVAPDADLKAVDQIACDVAAQVMDTVPGGVPGGECTVRFNAFSTLGITCAVNVRSRSYADFHLVRHELIKQLQGALLKAGIRLPTVEAVPARAARTS